MRATSTPPSASVALLGHRYGHERLWGRTYLAATLGLILVLAEMMAPAGFLITLAVGLSTAGYRRAVGRLAEQPSRMRVDIADLWQVIHQQVVGGGLAIGAMVVVVQLLELV